MEDSPNSLMSVCLTTSLFIERTSKIVTLGGGGEVGRQLLQLKWLKGSALK